MSGAPPYAGSRATALRAPLAVGGVVALATAYVAADDPAAAGHSPGCPLLALTGLYAPFCGSLRAVHALAHGDVAAAIGLHVLTVTGLAVLAGLWVVQVGRGLRGRRTPVVLPATAGPVLLVIAVVFAVLRNLPVGSALAP
jgi:hypothetical protein